MACGIPDTAPLTRARSAARGLARRPRRIDTTPDQLRLSALPGLLPAA